MSIKSDLDQKYLFSRTLVVHSLLSLSLCRVLSCRPELQVVLPFLICPSVLPKIRRAPESREVGFTCSLFKVLWESFKTLTIIFETQIG